MGVLAGGEKECDMKKGLFPSAETLAHIFKFYASVAIAAALIMLVVALVSWQPILLPVALLGFVCGRYQKEILGVASAYWREMCDNQWMSNRSR